MKEVHRTLKPGSYFWFYTEGDSLATEVWRVSVEILEEVSPVEIERVLKILNVSRPKTAHIMDGLKATYL